jgi:hypothetical protein
LRRSAFSLRVRGAGRLPVLRARTIPIILTAAALLLISAATASAAEDKALGRSATATSVSRDYAPGRAVDGSGSTRWSSAYLDNQKWTVDLGSVRSVDTVVVNWENAYASHYLVETSRDGATWSTAADVYMSSRQVKTSTFSARDARYVRINGIRRATQYGFSFWTVNVYGPSEAQSPSPTPSPSALFPAPATYDWYVAPNGSTSNSGRSASSPTTLSYASRNALPGETIGLLDGTYQITADSYGIGVSITRSGSATGGYIRYRSINPYGARFERAGGTLTNGGAMFYINPGVHHVSLEYLDIDGGSNPFTGTKGFGNGIVAKDQAHHLRFIGNAIRFTSSSGISTHRADYITAYGNLIWQCGNNPATSSGSWGSGISLWSNYYAYDNAATFHNVIVGNVIGGSVDTSSYNSDGNGIILDNPSGTVPSGYVSRPVLVANNVLYMNGGRGFQTLNHGRVWAVNNTVYKNGLDKRVGDPMYAPQFQSQGSYATDVNFVNNAASSWVSPNYALLSEGQGNFWRNTQFGGSGTYGISSTITGDPSRIRNVDPLFAAPPFVASSDDQQWLKAPEPKTLGSAFMPRDGSPLISAGIDPRSLPGLSSLLDATTTQYLLRDQAGNARPQGAGWDIGAYERG